MKQLLTGAAACAMLVFSAACHREATWEVKGDIEGAQGKTLLLEASSNGRWYLLDSVKIADNGSFRFKQPAAAFPGIYRVTLDGRSAFFPIDSAETVTLKANAAAFDSDYTLVGTPGAETMTKVNALISKAGNMNDSLKRDLANLILADPAGITAYYAISARGANGRLIFDPAVKADLRMIGAVANAYNDRRPNDPRTEYLKNLYLSSRQASGLSAYEPENTLTLNEISYFDIDLLDENGKPAKLSKLVERGPVMVNFTRYSAEYSPSVNAELNALREEYASKGLEVYQIGLDNDEYDWRQVARNLPWTTVFSSPKEGDAVLIHYNVLQLPTTYIINGKGELVDRIVDHTKLADSVKKHL